VRRVPPLERELTDRDLELMELALELAEEAVGAGQEPFGAVVATADGAILGRGHNTVRADLDPTAHGEIVAIRDAWRRAGSWGALRGATLYSSCAPCLACSFVTCRRGSTASSSLPTERTCPGSGRRWAAASPWSPSG
jgi:tRNA(Arg) A34 adenosine deaminase TadA